MNFTPSPLHNARINLRLYKFQRLKHLWGWALAFMVDNFQCAYFTKLEFREIAFLLFKTTLIYTAMIVIVGSIFALMYYICSHYIFINRMSN